MAVRPTKATSKLGKPVDDGQAMRYRMATLPLGSTATFTVWRRGKKVALNVPVEAPPEKPARNETLLKGNHPLTGATVVNLSPAVNSELGIDLMVNGVIVFAVESRSPAQRLRFKAGDIVLAINGEEVRTVKDLQRSLKKPTDQWRIALNRDGRNLNLAFSK